jgi:hypothetical protein
MPQGHPREYGTHGPGDAQERVNSVRIAAHLDEGSAAGGQVAQLLPVTRKLLHIKKLKKFSSVRR